MPSEEVLKYLREPYSRVIMPDGAGGYAAEILEFEGCFADGETPEEAYVNLEDVAESWLESALAQGWRIPPPIDVHEYSGALSLRLPKSLHRRAAEMAQMDGTSLNQFLVASIAAHVGAREKTAELKDLVDEVVRRRNAYVHHIDALFSSFDAPTVFIPGNLQAGQNVMLVEAKSGQMWSPMYTLRSQDVEGGREEWQKQIASVSPIGS